jgi:hypothetical protein
MAFEGLRRFELETETNSRQPDPGHLSSALSEGSSGAFRKALEVFSKSTFSDHDRRERYRIFSRK